MRSPARPATRPFSHLLKTNIFVKFPTDLPPVAYPSTYDASSPPIPILTFQTSACHPNPGYFLSHLHFTIAVVSSTTLTGSVTNSDLWLCISPAPSLLHSTFN
ncbi:unnamed protein product [Mesocestoides corti]|uniref:Ovule protein n=1 Tax=Mesocestoides corti TaxID=53468 RepID=A0A0R3U8J3_MESCO|nr:unnamed protein product [Mesocestoides corti]